MDHLRIQNSKQVKKIKECIKSQFGCDFSFEEYAVFMNNKEKIFIVTKHVGDVDFSKLRINSLGLYFGEMNNDFLRLSMDGAAMIAEFASKGIMELDPEDASLWMKGEDVKIDDENLNGYFIIKNEGDVLGCGRIVSGKLFNYVPKERRV